MVDITRRTFLKGLAAGAVLGPSSIEEVLAQEPSKTQRAHKFQLLTGRGGRATTDEKEVFQIVDGNGNAIPYNNQIEFLARSLARGNPFIQDVENRSWDVRMATIYQGEDGEKRAVMVIKDKHAFPTRIVNFDLENGRTNNTLDLGGYVYSMQILDNGLIALGATNNSYKTQDNNNAAGIYLINLDQMNGLGPIAQDGNGNYTAMRVTDAANLDQQLRLVDGAKAAGVVEARFFRPEQGGEAYQLFKLNDGNVLGYLINGQESVGFVNVDGLTDVDYQPTPAEQDMIRVGLEERNLDSGFHPAWRRYENDR